MTPGQPGATPHPINRWPWQWGIAALAATGLRLGLIWRFDVLQWPDSWDYIFYAQSLLASGGIWNVLTGSVPLSGFRSIGYPAVLATAMMLAGPAWVELVVGLQIVLSLAMLWGLYRFGLALGMARGLAALAVGLFACSHAAIYDASILTDAIAMHLLVLSLCVLLVPLLEGRAISIWRVLAVGLGIAVSMLVRDATLFLVPLLAFALAVMMRWRRLAWRRILLLQFCLLLPVIAIWQGYMSWSIARAGHPSFTSVGQAVYLLHPLEIEADGYPVLQDPRLREAYAATSASYTYGHALLINRYLMDVYGLTEWQRLVLAEKAYWMAWVSAPDRMLVEMLKELRPKYAAQLADLSMAIRDYPIMAGLEERTPRHAQALSTVLLLMVLRAVSILVFIGCVLGIPLALLRQEWRIAIRLRHEGLLFCWLIFAGMVGMYAMIHMEWRYSLPAQAFAVMAGVAVLAGAVRAVQHYRISARER